MAHDAARDGHACHQCGVAVRGPYALVAEEGNAGPPLVAQRAVEQGQVDVPTRFEHALAHEAQRCALADVARVLAAARSLPEADHLVVRVDRRAVALAA
eukprot:scaffold34327_cov157-Isochrysis_galbana.AAC.2